MILLGVSAQSHVHRQRFAVSYDTERKRIARDIRIKLIEEWQLLGDLDAVEGDYDVADLESGFPCRQISQDILDVDARIHGEFLFGFERWCDLYILYADDRPGDLAELLYGFDGRSDELLAQRKSERHTFPFIDSRRHGYGIAFDIEQRTSAIAGIGLRIGLIEAYVKVISVKRELLAFASEDAHSHGIRIFGEGIADGEHELPYIDR